MSVSESVSVSASVSVSVAPFTLNENSCQFSTLSYVHNCLARRQSVILYRDLQDSDGNGRPYQFFTVGGPIETERTLIWWHWIGDWHGNWCSLNTASNLIRKWLLFGHGDWYGHGDGHGDGHSVNVPLVSVLGLSKACDLLDNQSSRSPKVVALFLLLTLVAILYDFFNCMIQLKSN